jgi:mercuric ion transport protein
VKSLGVYIAAIASGIGASLCCTLPLLAVGLGVGSAGLAATFAPFAPFFTALTVILLGIAFYLVYRRRPEVECAPGEACAEPANQERQRRILWVVAVVALALATFPYYVEHIL